MTMASTNQSNNTIKIIDLNTLNINHLREHSGAEFTGYMLQVIAYSNLYQKPYKQRYIATHLGLKGKKKNLFLTALEDFFTRDNGDQSEDTLWTLKTPDLCSELYTTPLITTVQAPAQPRKPRTKPGVVQSLLDNPDFEYKPKASLRKQRALFDGPEIPGEPVTNSLMQQVYKIAEILFVGDQQRTPKEARACLQKILQQNPNERGLIFEVINDAYAKRNDILDPFAWVIRTLASRKEARLYQRGDQNRKHGRMTGPNRQDPNAGSHIRLEANKDTMNISEERLKIIRSKSKNVNAPLINFTPIEDEHD